MALSSALILYVFNILEVEAYLLHLFLLVVAWMLGLSASYIIEFYSRKNYENGVEILHMQKELKEQASHDYLTNLYNRRYFNELAQDIIKVAKREQKEYSVILLDIDKFKNINDTYGHLLGDEVIKLLASLLLKHTRESDVVSRFGGEEFAILLPFTNTEGACKIAEQLRIVVDNQKVKIDENQSIRFTISLGVDAINNDRDTDIAHSLDRADKALYIAKNAGRNRVELYTIKE